MIIIFKIILILTIWCLGVKIVTANGMLLQWLGEWGEEQVDKGYKIFEAIIVCPFCLPSVHSILGYAFAYGLGLIELDWKLLIMWPIVVMGSSILSGFTWTAYQTINQIKEKNEAETEYFKMLINPPEEENNN